MKHGYQFEKGKLSFKMNPNGEITRKPGSLYDITDEEEAHKSGGTFGGSGSTDINSYKGMNSNENSLDDIKYKQMEDYKSKRGKTIMSDEIYRYNEKTHDKK